MRRHSSQRMTSSGGGVTQPVELDAVELEPAAPAPALPQRGGADTALLLADLLVQRDEVRRGSAPAWVRPRRALLLGLRVDLGGGRVARGGQLGGPGQGGLALSVSRPPGPATTPQPLHHLEDDLLEVTLAAAQRRDLVLQALELLGGRDLPGVEPLLVALGPGPDLVDVALGLGQLARQVALLGLRDDDLVAQHARLGLQLGERGVLGQGATAVRELVEPGVEGLQVEQAALVGMSGFQCGLLAVVAVGSAPAIARPRGR